jgi:hypothetical protein
MMKEFRPDGWETQKKGYPFLSPELSVFKIYEAGASAMLQALRKRNVHPYIESITLRKPFDIKGTIVHIPDDEPEKTVDRH